MRWSARYVISSAVFFASACSERSESSIPASVDPAPALPDDEGRSAPPAPPTPTNARDGGRSSVDASPPEGGPDSAVAQEPFPYFIDTSKPAMTYAALVASRLFPGMQEVPIGNFTLAGRSRSCTKLAGCSTWSAGGLPLMQLFDGAGSSAGTPHLHPTYGPAKLVSVPLTVPTVRVDLSGPEPASPQRVIRFRCSGVKEGGVADTFDCTLDVVAGNEAVPLSFDASNVIPFRGRIFADGAYLFVSRLASETGGAVDSANNKYQIALHGTL